MKKLKYFSKYLFFSFFFVLLFFAHDSLKAQAVVDTFNLPSGYVSSNLRIKNALNIDLSNHVWIGFRNIGAGKFDGTNWTVFDTTNGLPSNNVLSFAFEGTNDWIGTDSGLAKYDGAAFTVYNSFNSSLTSNHILSLFADGGNLWIGTYDGVFLFKGSTWSHFNSTNSSLPGDTVTCFERNGNDTIWIGTSNGVASYFNSSWKTYSIFSPGIPREKILNIKMDASENLWIETDEEKISILKNDFVYHAGNFFSICSNVLTTGSIVGLNSFGNIIYLNGSIEELNLDSANAWASGSNYYGPLFSYNGFQLAVAALDQNNVLWYSRITNYATLLFSVDYRNALLPLQQSESCGDFLDINNVSARLDLSGSMFWDEVGTARYEVPKGSGLNSIFADGLWIGGMDNSSNLHIAAQTYRQSGEDFWPGPLDTTNATVDSATVAQYDHIWKINRYTVTEFKNEYAAGNVTSFTYPVPDVILNWPASGNGNYSRNLAPFIDVNHDGVYNPYDGDYPDMKGDQMLWGVFNDNYLMHRQSEGVSLGIEVQLSAYAYRCMFAPDTEQAVNNTTFFHYRIINRSDTDYSQVYMGKYLDVDLGNYNDDFVGCDSALGIAFVYNGDNFDEGIAGYGYNPPMQNLLLLNPPLTNFMYFYDDFTAPFGNPVLPRDYYNYLRSAWLNDVHLTYGGNGYGGTDSTNFMYSSNPYDTTSTSWNETTTGNLSGDRRFLASTGPFSFPSHSEKEFDMAYVWTRDDTQPNGLTSSWAKNVHDILKIKEWYAADSFPCSQFVGIAENNSFDANLNLYPNPAGNLVTIFAGSKNASPLTLEITDVAGRKISSRRILPNLKTQIGLDSFAPGIYFVSIRNKETFAVKKLIRQ